MIRAAKDLDAKTAKPSSTSTAEGNADTSQDVVSRNVLVRDTGFREDDWSEEFTRWSGASNPSTLTDGAALDIENTVPAEDIVPVFERIALIRIFFPSHSDGRGFSLARHLRLLGYQGRLRASGHILADQYAMTRRSGFDEVEIDPALAERQPEEQWLFRANWQTYDYQQRLGRRPYKGIGALQEIDVLPRVR